MKVLFIISDNHQEDNRFPLWAAYLASVLKEHNISVTTYCQDTYHYPNAHLANYLANNKFDAIGLSFTASRFRDTILPISTIINNYKEDALFIVGGHCPSAIPEYVKEQTKADTVIVGEAENCITQVVQNKLKGIINSKPIKCLDDIPYPAWELFPINRYSSCMQFYGHEPNDKYISTITSRGCINQCSFCFRMHKGYRLRSINDIIGEMKILKEKYDINYFEIQDEMFVTSKKRLLEFRNKLKENNLEIKFTCDARVDYFDKEILNLLIECGCKFLNFGFESVSQKVLDLMHKRTTVKQNYRAAELTKKSGIALGLNFLWGNKGDSIESLQNMVQFIKTFNTYFQLRTIRPVTPYPGCDLYYDAIDKGMLKGPEDFFNKFKNADLLTINYTTIPEKEFYEALYLANRELILDHYEHTTQDTEEAFNIIQQFYNLYFKGDTTFRGPRSYARQLPKNNLSYKN